VKPKPYPKYVRKKSIIKTDFKHQALKNYRTWLRATIEPKGMENIVFIGMNPSAANEVYSDDTVNSLLDYAKRLSEEKTNQMNIKNVIITNIIPIYESNSSSLQNAYENVIEKIGSSEMEKIIKSNLGKVLRAIRISDYIVLCWGNPYINDVMHRKITSSILESVKHLDKEIFVFNFKKDSNVLTVKGHPKHYGYTREPEEIISVDIRPYYYLEI